MRKQSIYISDTDSAYSPTSTDRGNGTDILIRTEERILPKLRT